MTILKTPDHELFSLCFTGQLPVLQRQLSEACAKLKSNRINQLSRISAGGA